MKSIKDQLETANKIIEAISKGIMEKQPSINYMAEYFPPDPDLDLMNKWEELADWIKEHNNLSIGGAYTIAKNLNLLATQAHDNEVRVNVLDEVLVGFINKDGFGVRQNSEEFRVIKELRTHYAEGES